MLLLVLMTLDPSVVVGIEIIRKKLENMKLPSTEHMLSLARVSSEVLLKNVTGDIAPLLSSLTCTQLLIDNMELDQAATCSGVSSMTLSNMTGDIGPLLASLTCSEIDKRHGVGPGDHQQHHDQSQGGAE